MLRWQHIDHYIISYCSLCRWEITVHSSYWLLMRCYIRYSCYTHGSPRSACFLSATMTRLSYGFPSLHVQGPSNFFHQAYPNKTMKITKQPDEAPPTNGQKRLPSVLYRLDGMFIAKAPAMYVLVAIPKDAMVSVSWSWMSSFRWLSSWMLT